jgi:hypothetical protein
VRPEGHTPPPVARHPHLAVRPTMLELLLKRAKRLIARPANGAYQRSPVNSSTFCFFSAASAEIDESFCTQDGSAWILRCMSGRSPSRSTRPVEVRVSRDL